MTDFRNLFIPGESGLGKSTLVNSMFMSDIYNNEYPGPSHRIKKTVAVSGVIRAVIKTIILTLGTRSACMAPR